MGFGSGFSGGGRRRPAAITTSSGSDGQVAIFQSGSNSVVGYENLTFDGNDMSLTGTLQAQGIQSSNVYTGDLHLKNERGDWTLYEEKDHIVMQNNITGEKFTLMMEKIKK